MITNPQRRVLEINRLEKAMFNEIKLGIEGQGDTEIFDQLKDQWKTLKIAELDYQNRQFKMLMNRLKRMGIGKPSRIVDRTE